MTGGRKIALGVASLVLLLSLAGSVLTRGAMEHLPFLHGQQGWTTTVVPHGIVDQRPWQTAAALTPLAVSAEEQELAREAERLADHEVDQNFAQSLRQASAEVRPLKGKSLALEQRVIALQQTLKEDQARIDSLTPKAGTAAAAVTAAEASPDGAVSDLEIAKAQMGLDQDELADSMEDLARESGDQRTKIQHELSARQAAMKKLSAQAQPAPGETAVVAATQYRTLASQIAAWRAQRNRMQLLRQAGQLATADVAALTADHVRLGKEATEAHAEADGTGGTGRLKALQRAASERLVLSLLDDRLDAQQQLVALYGRWAKQVELQHEIVIHLMLQSLSLIAGIAVATLLAGWVLQAALRRLPYERRQMQTLRTILNLGTQLLGLVLVLVVIFGAPSQTPTILGLATAGLTVVFQDFILAFCGWFVLMGRHGIRVGDWVEIDGVGGEVVEVGLFRTWLLETGNWTANGHPTGRRVSFLNGFAIRGKYFNFSTAGQWMWDEIKVSLPAEAPLYPLIDKLRTAAVKATEADAQQAEEEWKRVTHEEGTPQFSATPSVTMRPAGGGVDLVVRYITRAGVRLETRDTMFRGVVELMRGEDGGTVGAENEVLPERPPAVTS